MLTEFIKKLTSGFSPTRKMQKEKALLLHRHAMATSRQPAFYLYGGMEDSIDGRFNGFIIHIFILFYRMAAVEGWKETGAYIADEIVRDIEDNLRELGAGDMKIGDKVKQKIRIFYGCLDAYWGALEGCANFSLAEALGRNLFHNQPDQQQRSAAMADYVRAQIDHLSRQKEEEILAGRVEFKPVHLFFSPPPSSSSINLTGIE